MSASFKHAPVVPLCKSLRVSQYSDEYLSNATAAATKITISYLVSVFLIFAGCGVFKFSWHSNATVKVGYYPAFGYNRYRRVF